MISVFFFCTRQSNLEKILSTYQTYDFIDEILIVHLEPLEKGYNYSKAKFIHMPKSSDLGLLSRYTFSLSCKNRHVFIQDDDWLFKETFFQKVIRANQPLVGAHGRWLENGKYIRKKTKGLSTAPIILTTGVLVDTCFLPKVIEYSKDFWLDYQNVFNGEDIFLSRAISYITGIEEFMFFHKKDNYEFLDVKGHELSKEVNSSIDRTNITKKIYSYFNDNKK